MSENPSFGNLKTDPNAKNRRRGVKFFDSADWAMRNQQGGSECQLQDSPPTTTSLDIKPNNSYISEDVSPLSNLTDSPLFG